MLHGEDGHGGAVTVVAVGIVGIVASVCPVAEQHHRNLVVDAGLHQRIDSPVDGLDGQGDPLPAPQGLTIFYCA